MPKRLQVGDVAPDFSLVSSTGDSVHLYDTLQHSEVVLFFYPRAFTPVCTAEVCGFRDAMPQFAARNAAVFGISSDNPDTLARFASQHALTFPLLSDSSSRIRISYGVPKMFGVLPGRVTYVIGQDRQIKQITIAGFDAHTHISRSLQRLQESAIGK